MRFENVAVADSLSFGVSRVAVEVVDGLKRDKTKDAIAKEIAETLRRGGIQADVLVHMERIDAGPVDVPIGNE